jgi:hypothetical protein
MQTHLNSSNVTKTQFVSLITIFVSLITILEEVPDPRVTATVEHDLSGILTIALCTILCGGDSFYDMEEFGQVRLDWLKTVLRLRNGAPTHDTYNRVFQALDSELFGECLSRWTQSVRGVLGGEVVALGGKQLMKSLETSRSRRYALPVPCVPPLGAEDRRSAPLVKSVSGLGIVPIKYSVFKLA